VSRFIQLIGQVHGAKQDSHPENGLHDFRRGFDSVYHGHREIDDDQIWLQGAGLLNSLETVGRFAANFPIKIFSSSRARKSVMKKLSDRLQIH
jgi:hypothetical protein